MSIYDTNGLMKTYLFSLKLLHSDTNEIGRTHTCNVVFWIPQNEADVTMQGRTTFTKMEGNINIFSTT